jgi:hypothetical protein
VRFEEFPIVNRGLVEDWLDRFREEGDLAALERLVNHLRERWRLAGYAQEILADVDVRRLWHMAPHLLPDEYQRLLIACPRPASENRTTLPVLAITDPETRLRLVAHVRELMVCLSEHEWELGFPGIAVNCSSGEALAEQSNCTLVLEEKKDEEEKKDMKRKREGGEEEDGEEVETTTTRASQGCLLFCLKHVRFIVSTVRRMLPGIQRSEFRFDGLSQALVRLMADRAFLVQAVPRPMEKKGGDGGGGKTTKGGKAIRPGRDGSSTTTATNGYRDVGRVSLRWSMMRAVYEEACSRDQRSPPAAVYVFLEFVAEERRFGREPLTAAASKGRKTYEDPLRALWTLSNARMRPEQCLFKSERVNRVPPPSAVIAKLREQERSEAGKKTKGSSGVWGRAVC